MVVEPHHPLAPVVHNDRRAVVRAHLVRETVVNTSDLAQLPADNSVPAGELPIRFLPGNESQRAHNGASGYDARVKGTPLIEPPLDGAK